MGFGGLGAKVGGHGVDAVRFFTEFHSAIFASCQDVEDHGVLVRRILMNHLECPVAARTEEQMVVWIETGSVHTLAMPETNSEGKRIKHVPSRVSSSTGDFPVQDEVWLARASTGRLNLESQRSASLADHYRDGNGENRLRRYNSSIGVNEFRVSLQSIFSPLRN